MNFRYIIEDTDIYSHISSTRNHSYICVDNANKYIFSLLEDEIRDYPLIDKLIKQYRPNTKFKITKYYICKQIDSSHTYVPAVGGRLYRYLYKRIIEVTRSKYEDNTLKHIEKKESVELPKPIRIINQYTTSGTSTCNYLPYLTTNTTE